MKESQKPAPPSGEALAYSMGMQAGEKRDLTSNPQFSSYSERIAYRAGWMDAAKQKAANVKVSSLPHTDADWTTTAA